MVVVVHTRWQCCGGTRLKRSGVTVLAREREDRIGHMHFSCSLSGRYVNEDGGRVLGGPVHYYEGKGRTKTAAKLMPLLVSAQLCQDQGPFTRRWPASWCVRFAAVNWHLQRLAYIMKIENRASQTSSRKPYTGSRQCTINHGLPLAQVNI